MALRQVCPNLLPTRWSITVRLSEIGWAVEFVATVSVVILTIFYSLIGTKNSFYFLFGAVVALFLSFFFGDVVKVRFYAGHGRYHIHHALYGIILLGVDVLFLNSNLFFLGIVWGLLLSEAKFFITERRRTIRHLLHSLYRRTYAKPP